MSLLPISKQHAAGVNVYFALRKSDGTYFDFSDNAWKALASVTTVGLAATEQTLAVGVSNYVASLDLADVNPGLAEVDCVILAFQRSGGAPAPLADTLIAQPYELMVQLSDVGPKALKIDAALGVTTTSGTELALIVSLSADGELVPLHALDPAATCAVDILRQGNFPQLSLTTGDMGAVNAAHKFEPVLADPNFTADRLYSLNVTIVADGVTITREANKTFAVVP